MIKFPFTLVKRVMVIEKLGHFPWTSLNDLLLTWKAGTKGYITVHKEGKPKSPEQLGYYYALILPEAVKAFEKAEDFSLTIEFGEHRIEVELTLKNMDSFMKQRYAAKTGIHVNKADMNMEDCSIYETWCIKWLATWLKCQIPPADKNWRTNNE